MTTIILVILGVLLAAAAALMVIFYGGEAFSDASSEAEAARLVKEGAEIEGAIELFTRQEHRYPGYGSKANGLSPTEDLKARSYLTHMPQGSKMVDDADWVINYDDARIETAVGSAENDDALEVCRNVRRQLKIPDPETVPACDEVLSSRESCCIKPAA